MKILMILIALATLVEVEGAGAALAGILTGLGLDIPITLVTGGALVDVFTGWGLIDDILMAFLRVGWGVPDKFLFGVVVEEGTHMAQEAFEYYDHTDAQNRRYAAHLAHQNPGQTYVYGDVTHRDIYELGISLGVLAYRRRSAFEVLEGIFDEFFSSEATADVIAIGAV
jgi:hypothetical protein